MKNPYEVAAGLSLGVAASIGYMALGGGITHNDPPAVAPAIAQDRLDACVVNLPSEPIPEDGQVAALPEACERYSDKFTFARFSPAGGNEYYMMTGKKLSKLIKEDTPPGPFPYKFRLGAAIVIGNIIGGITYYSTQGLSQKMAEQQDDPKPANPSRYAGKITILGRRRDKKGFYNGVPLDSLGNELEINTRAKALKPKSTA